MSAESKLVPGRVRPGQSGWVTRVVLPPDNDENQYIDVVNLPIELTTYADRFLPIDFQNQRFQRDLVASLHEMMEHERDMGVLPFVVYLDPLTMLMRAKEPIGTACKRSEPLTDPEKIQAAAEHGTITMFDLHRIYQAALKWFSGLSTDEFSRERIRTSLGLHKTALQLRANVIFRAVLQIPGVSDVLLQMKDPSCTIASCYSEKIALEFGDILRTYLCSAIRLLQHVVMRIVLMNPDCLPHFTPVMLSDDTPPPEHIANFVVAAQQDHQRNFVKFCNSISAHEKRTPYFDEEHINSHPGKRRGDLSPSLLFQTMLHMVIGDTSQPLPETAEPVKA